MFPPCEFPFRFSHRCAVHINPTYGNANCDSYANGNPFRYPNPDGHTDSNPDT